jgi:hypothetical protein
MTLTKRKLLSIFLSLAMLLSLFSGLGGAAWAAESAAPEMAVGATTAVPETSEVPDGEAEAPAEPIETAPEEADISPAEKIAGAFGLGAPTPTPPPDPSAVPIAPGGTITAAGVYVIDTTTVSRGTITITTPGAVTIWGQGVESDQNYAGISIVYTVSGADLTLSALYISAPNGSGPVIDFTGSGNKLSVLDESTAILESNGYNNAAVVHVGKGGELTIGGTSDSYLYLYKSSSSAAIGGNTNESSGAITFASGNTFIKGTQTGPSVGGDDTTGATTNDDITISGGLLCVETNARGAGIGASALGECAGNVYITGGSTLINVDWTGSAIGRGASGRTVGDLFVSGGSLKTYIDPNAIGNWQVDNPGPNNIIITANKHYGTPANPQHGNVAEVDVSGLNTADTITAVFNPDGQSPRVVYNRIGLNQYDYTADQTYTPDNWTDDTGNTKLYLYGPEGTRGCIAVSDASGMTQNYYYTSGTPTDSSYFTPAPTTDEIVSFFADNAAVTVDGTQIYYSVVPQGGSLTFAIVPATGYQVAGVTANGTVIDPDASGNYTLSDVQTNYQVVVTTVPAPTNYTVTFTAPNATVYVNGQPVTSATIAAGGTLAFTVVPAAGYGITGVTATNGTITGSDGEYTLSQVTANTTVAVATAAAYNVTFVGASATAGNMQVRVSGVSTTSATVLPNGTLDFTVVPDLGYEIVGTPTATNGTITGAGGSYTLSGVTANTTVTVTTQAASGFWTANADTTWYNQSAASFTLTTAAQLAGLAKLVNSGTDFAGKTVTLGNDIDLSAYGWAPIGGGRDFVVTGLFPVPVSPSSYFAGTFNGAGYTVSGMTLTIPTANDGSGAYGLFGYVKGGVILNLAVSGVVASAQDIDAVGGVVGYSTGTLLALSNAANITLSGPDVSETGGVVGVLANTAAGTQLTISESANIAPITGRSRLGGVVGATYSSGDAVAINMCFNTGDITANNSRGRAYVGGVVGYSMGAVNNSYNQGNITTGAGDIYAGGIAGLLNGAAAPFGSITDSYNTGLVSGSGISLQALYGYADDSPSVSVSDSGFLDNMKQDQLGATLTNVWRQSQQFMQSQAVLGSGYLNAADFTQFSSDYPVLNPQILTITSGDKSVFDNALGALTGAVNIIVIDSLPIGIPSSTTTIDIGGVNGKIYRAPGYGGDLFTVTGTGILNIVSGVIDGNTQATGATGSLVSVGGASALLTISGGTLKNNVTSANGGAVFINAGTVTMTGGTITGNTTTGNGGGVYISANGVFNLNGGTISGNTAALGQGIYATGTGTVYPIVINPAAGDVINVSDIIYLDGTNVRIDLLTTLTSSNISTPLLIQVSNPMSDRNTVRAVDNAGATASVPYTKRWNGGDMRVGTGRFILYNGDTLNP